MKDARFEVGNLGIVVFGDVVKEDDNFYYMWSAEYWGRKISCPDFGSRKYDEKNVLNWIRERGQELAYAELCRDIEEEEFRRLDDFEARYGWCREV